MPQEQHIRTYPSIYLTVEEKLTEIAALRAALESDTTEEWFLS